MERMKWMLFPFRFATWLKLGFIGWLAGEMAGGANFNFPSSFPGRQKLPPGGFPGIHFPSGAIVLIIAAVIVFVFILGLVFVFISSRFRFILFDSVIYGQASIGRAWSAYRDAANRYLGFSLVWGFFSLLIAGLMIGLPVWRAYKRGVFSGGDILGPILVLVFSIIFMLGLFVLVNYVIGTIFRDFVAPLLALDQLRLGEAWSHAWQLMRAEPGAFAGYIGLKVLLGIAAAIGMAFASIIVVIALFIPAIIIALVLIAVGSALGSKAAIAALVAVGVALALVFLAALFTISLALQAPVVVFFESYRQYFFAGRCPRLEALLWPAPPVQPTPPAPETEMPPPVPPPLPEPGMAG